MKNAILIPAYNPDDKLVRLVSDLTRLKMPIIIVNDGSSMEYESIFYLIKSEYFVKVINHDENKGKGAALKTGIEYIKHHYPECNGIITADSDGQHLPKDIKKIGDAIIKNANALILGVRNFSQDKIPLRSRFGNKLTSFVFYLSTQIKCQDTQTGLRGIPRALFDQCLAISGERYEYEMNMLMQCAKDHILFVYEEIETVYIDGNESSHFNPILDSFKIYFNILKFSLSSLSSCMVDIVIFTVLMSLLNLNMTSKIFVATVLARLISGIFNFIVNKIWVFSSSDQVAQQSLRYILLFLCVMVGSYLGVSLLSFLPIPMVLIKMIVDGTLFALSYKVQKQFIFKEVI